MESVALAGAKLISYPLCFLSLVCRSWSPSQLLFYLLVFDSPILKIETPTPPNRKPSLALPNPNPAFLLCSPSSHRRWRWPIGSRHCPERLRNRERERGFMGKEGKRRAEVGRVKTRASSSTASKYADSKTPISHFSLDQHFGSCCSFAHCWQGREEHDFRG